MTRALQHGRSARHLGGDDKFPASEIPYTPSGTLTEDNVQGAIDQLEAAAAAAESGEANTLSSLGAGTSLVGAKSGVDLRVKSLEVTGSLAISSTSTTITIHGTGEANDGQNLGSGLGWFAQKSGDTLQFKSLIAGQGVVLSSSSTAITLRTAYVQSSDPGAVGAGAIWVDT